MYEVRCLYCAAFSTQFGVSYLDILDFCFLEYHIVILSFCVLSGGRLLSLLSNHCHSKKHRFVMGMESASAQTQTPKSKSAFLRYVITYSF